MITAILNTLVFFVAAAVALDVSHPRGDYVRRSPEYGFGFYNATGQELEDSGITWVGDGRFHSAGGGVMAVGSTKTQDDEPAPIPEKVTAFWKTADGKMHRKEVEVAPLVTDLKGFTGTIWLKFTNEGVTVVPMTNKEQDRLAFERKPIRPE
ncbi:MAG: hypothetical protein JWL69_1861 [Phycisphaerales bacterium]|nr:hypothetical protein [Phycisphaerales bacterium]